MTLSIDAARAFRYDSDLRRLVLAIRDGGVHGETEWVEWKIAIDNACGAEPLLTAQADELIATTVLGFANRLPEVAANWAEGHAYLLIGVQPGDVRGIATSDPEKIHSRIRRYVGGRISWRPEYTTIDGRRVLVVIVDPPQQGDPIHTLQKGMQRRQPGTIFVRHPGKTEQADPHDIERLTARAHVREARLGISIIAAAGRIEAVVDPSAHFRAWIETQRAALLRARHNEPSYRYQGFDMTAMLRVLNEPDARTEEEYAEEVETYLKQAEPALTIRALRRQARRIQTMLALDVDNPADDSVVGLIVEAHVLGATGYAERFLHETDEHAEPDLPARPVAFGTPRQMGGLAALLASAGVNTRGHPPSLIPHVGRFRSARGWSAHNQDNMIHVMYDPIDLRPATKIKLPLVPLRVLDDGRSSVRVVWTAASINLKGRLDGAFDLPVVSATFDLLSVFDVEPRRRRT